MYRYSVSFTLLIIATFVLPNQIGEDSFLWFIGGNLSDNEFYGITFWSLIFLLLEPLFTPRRQRLGWFFQKFFWTLALLCFYAIAVFHFDFDDLSLVFFMPFLVYVIRMIIPYEWVRRWTLVFYSLEDEKS